ncbi:MAG: hypothetical protein ACMXX7_00930 [Candidatus Woesearchaeota archaeon]
MNKKIIFLIALLIFIAGCSQSNPACTQGSNCRFYTGSEGVRMDIDYAANSLYYHSDDIFDQDGNSIDFSINVRNRGASDAIGAVFITGFSPNIFTIYRYTNQGVIPVNPYRGGGCGFSLFAGPGGIPSGFGSCGGFSAGGGPGGFSLGFTIGAINELFGWNIPAEGQINIFIDSQGRLSFGGVISTGNIHIMYHGKLLISMIYNTFDFAAYGGHEFFLRGDNPEYPGGGQDVLDFRVRMHGQWPAGTDQYNIPYQIKSCYAYTTFASPNICIDQRPQVNEQKNCQATRTVNLGTQGAPVAITRMEQINTGRTVQLKFEIQNVGNGRVWDVGRLEECSPYYPSTGTGISNKDIVYIGYIAIEDALVGIDPYLTCNRRSVRLVNGRGEFTCTYDYTAAGAAVIGGGYETPIRIELWYGYEQMISRTLRVIRAS